MPTAYATHQSDVCRITMKCANPICVEEWEIESGSHVDLPGDCPFSNIEEAQLFLRHMLAKGQGHQLRRTHGIEPKRWAAFLGWVLPILKETAAESFRTCRGIVKKRDPDEVFSSSFAGTASDGRWLTVGRTSQWGSVYTCDTSPDGIPLSSYHMCMNTTAEEFEKFGILQWQGTSKGMEQHGTMKTLREIQDDDITVQDQTMDGDSTWYVSILSPRVFQLVSGCNRFNRFYCVN
jgi:hypothetical protein